MNWPPALRPRFLFLRHGESAANVGGLVAGSLDVPLTPKGIDQARAAAAQLADMPIARVVASALARSVATAEPIARCRGLPVEILPGIGERDWGPFEGGPVAARPPELLDPPGAEPWAVFAARVLAALASLSGDGPTVIVAHRGVFRVLAEVVGAPGAAEGLRNAVPCWVHVTEGEVSPFRRRTVTSKG